MARCRRVAKGQLHMFTDGSDLPLFSGTCPVAVVGRFVKPDPAAAQPALFRRQPTWEEMQQAHRRIQTRKGIT